MNIFLLIQSTATVLWPNVACDLGGFDAPISIQGDIGVRVPLKLHGKTPSRNAQQDGRGTGDRSLPQLIRSIRGRS